MMSFVAVLITELRAFDAARFAMVFEELFEPPRTEFIMFVLIDLATELAALETAFSAVDLR